jgi:nucleoside-diphosphate-sugar epimerase
MFENASVLITGGAGFLGSYVCNQLIREGAHVTVLDNFSSGVRERLRPLFKCAQFRLVTGDIRDETVVKECVKNMDIVFHLAAKVGVIRAASQGIDVLDTSLKGISLLLSESVHYNVSTFVFSSSSEVYGEPARLPSREDDPLQPQSTYAIAFVISRFLQCALLGVDLHVYGDGSQTRDFCYIDDAVQLTLEAVRRSTGAHIYNIGSGKKTSLTQLAECVAALSPHSCQIKYIPLDGRRPHEYEIVRRQADISKIVNMCGFSPQYTLEKGLQKCFEALM